MAKTSSAVSNPYIGRDITPAGFMPTEMAARHGLSKSNSAGPTDTINNWGILKNRKVKRDIEAMKAYRLAVHNVIENKLARPLVLGGHYMMTPLSKNDDSGGSNYRKPSLTVETQGDDPTIVPLKV